MFRRGASILIAPFAIACLWATSSATGSGYRLEVPYQRQVHEGCASAAIAMVMRYWKQQVPGLRMAEPDPADIHRQIYSKSDHGSPASAVEKHLRETGLRTFGFRGAWSDIEEHIPQGRPLMVAIRAPGSRTRLHYVVVVGVSTSHVLLHDPARTPAMLVERSEFESRWKAAERWTLLALPPQ